jgi:hypothetical protein
VARKRNTRAETEATEQDAAPAAGETPDAGAGAGDADDQQAEEGAAPAPKKKKNGRLTGFTSHGKRFRAIALPRDVHEALVADWPEGTQYEVAVEEGGVVVARPVAAP